MSVLLRCEMIFIAVFFVIGIFKAVNRNKVRLQYSLIWLVVSMGVIALGFFPEIIIWLSDIMNIQTPTNLLYLFSIIALLVITFYLTVIVSRQSDKIQKMIQMISIEQYYENEKEKTDENNKR